MKSSTSEKKRYSALITLIVAGEVIFFLPFLVPRIFRPTMLDVFGINNLQLGSFFSVYGIIAMVSYAFGGPLADRFPARKLMAVALWLTALGGFMMALIPPTAGIFLVYGFWGFTTIFLFWAAMIRATREWGGDAFQGRAFGFLEGGRGFVAASLGTLSWLVFAKFTLMEQIPGSSDAVLSPMQIVLLVTSVITLATGVLVWFAVPENRQLYERDTPLAVLQKIRKLMKLPSLWLLAIIVICAYSGYKITDDFSLYASEVLGFNDVNAAATGTGALWLRGIVAILTGLVADRLNRARLMSFAFSFALLFGLITGLGILESSIFISILNLVFVAVGVYALRALYFAVLDEARIPLALTGTAVGIVSFLGYTPEVFMGPWMGRLLDSHPGVEGHRDLFLVLTGFGFVGLLASLLFQYYSVKYKG